MSCLIFVMSAISAISKVLTLRLAFAVPFACRCGDIRRRRTVKGVVAAALSAGICLVTASAAAAASTPAASATSRPYPDTRFNCGGEIETRVWAAWDQTMHAYIEQQLLRQRLLKDGDVYALYDFQSLVQNLVAMARRCNRVARLREIAGLLAQAYGALEAGQARPDDRFDGGPRWICRGGKVCNDRNRLLHKEVPLNSAQLLGLALTVANALASFQPTGAPARENKNNKQNDRQGRGDREFIDDTIRIATAHLLRWDSDPARRRLRKAIAARPEDMTSASTELLFTDFDLWQMTMYAELAGLLRWRGMQGPWAGQNGERERMARHFATLLDFFSARLSYRRREQTGQGDRPGQAEEADLDRGFWRELEVNRYAGYTKEEKPVECVPAAGMGGRTGEMKAHVRVPPDKAPQDPRIGWDISHARRLVPALDALERNRKAAAEVFPASAGKLPPAELARAFANTLVASIWNGDRERPLFANYWSGANGWYRVAWDDGTGKCREGYPPSGMSDAFATGGYIAWAKYRPVLGMLGRRLHEILDAPEAGDSPFVLRYYPSFGHQESAGQRRFARMAFMASTVEAPAS